MLALRGCRGTRRWAALHDAAKATKVSPLNWGELVEVYII